MDKFLADLETKSRWHAALTRMIPTYGRDINKEPELYEGRTDARDPASAAPNGPARGQETIHVKIQNSFEVEHLLPHICSMARWRA